MYRTTLPRGTLHWALAGMLLAGAVGPVLAQTHGPIDRNPLPIAPWGAMNVTMEVLVDNQPVPTIAYQGKMYLPVPRLGAEYAIRVSNHGPRRIVAMISVDGLSVITGQPAAEDQPGYVVAPRSHIVIRGWRRNLSTVAAFSFQDRERSYAVLMGRPDNVGVIGLIAIEEATYHPLRPRAALDGRAAPSMQRSTVGNTGTGYGRDINSGVYYVPFIRSSNRRTITIWYDTVAALRAVGVPVDQQPLPTPFPGDHEFAPPPPGDPRR